MAGLWKVLGHPIVDMTASTATWFRKGTVMKLGLERAATGINNMFVKEFCRQYYKTHKKWPNLTMTEMCYLANEWGETSTYKWDPDDFKGVILGKNFEFNFQLDTIDIISDKSIIPRRSEWIHEYDVKAFRTVRGKFPQGPPQTTKSVVMHYLTTEVYNITDIIFRLHQT